jgi:hypothetical protein
MILRVGRIQLIGIAAILALFFVSEFAIMGGGDAPQNQALVSTQR